VALRFQLTDRYNSDAGPTREVPGQPGPVAIQPPEPKSIASETGVEAVDGPTGQELSTARTVSPIRKEVRRRNKAHLAFVGAQRCLVCQRSPCDAHHLKFAQPRSLGRKVSDEFTVPLCRDHHYALHRHGNEIAWWANLQITPIEIARGLWETTVLQKAPSIPGKAEQAVPDFSERA
jgi:hypothetical protein